MILPWKIFCEEIRAGMVLRDEQFIFTDGEIKAKWIVILSNEIKENNYIYCLTTSQKHTYKNSYSDYVISDDPVFPIAECIIEVERINLLKLNSIKRKYENGIIQYKGYLKEKTLKKVFEKIDESS